MLTQFKLVDPKDLSSLVEVNEAILGERQNAQS
jgi:hypothetical protein